MGNRPDQGQLVGAVLCHSAARDAGWDYLTVIVWILVVAGW